MTLTLEEQERRAYITGDVERARLLAAVIDAAEDANDEGHADGYDEGYGEGFDEGFAEAKRRVISALE